MMNTAQFSAAKSAAEGKMLQEAIFDKEGAVKPYSQFFKDAADIAAIQQETWLRVERDMCVSQCVQGEAFRAMQADADLYPYWIYSGAMDDREREEHLVLEGLAFKIGDPAGDACFPPNGWNCRCRGESADKDDLGNKRVLSNSEAKKHLEENVNEQFRYNPAIQGPMPNNGSYFEVLKNANECSVKNIVEPEQPKEKSRSEVIEEAVKRIESYKISERDKEAIELYSGGSYREVNEFLRGLSEKSYLDRQETKILDFLPSALKSAPKIEVESYRAIGLSSKDFSKYKSKLKVGGIFSDKAFLSTSLEKSITTGFAYGEKNIHFSIKGKSGVLIEKYSLSPSEREVLFNKKTVFKIEEIRQEGDKLFVTLIEP